jgi:hypothetical protein
MIPLVIGGIVGKHGSNTQWSMFLNVPYVLFPYIFAYQIISKEKTFKIQKDNSSISKIFGYFLMFCYLCLIMFSFIRFFAVVRSPLPLAENWVKTVEPYLHDPNGPAFMQILSIAYFGIPFFIFAIFHIYHEKDVELTDFVCLFSGAMAQSQFSFIGSSLRNISTNPEPTWKPVPQENFHIFLIVNLLFVIIPNLHFLRLMMLKEEKIKK